MRDLIQVTDLELRTRYLNCDHWQRSFKEQPLICTLSIETSISSEAEQDNLSQTSLNYGTVTKTIENFISQLEEPEQGEEGYSLEFLGEELSKVILFKANAPNVLLELRRPRALLSADSIGVSLYRSRSDYSQGEEGFKLLPNFESFKKDYFFIRGLKRFIIIGLNDCERLEEQEVLLDFDFYSNQSEYEMLSTTTTNTTTRRVGWSGWREMVKKLESHLSSSKPLTIELITTSLAKIITTPPPPPPNSSSSTPDKLKWDVPLTRVKLSKPVAIMFAKAPSISILRQRSDFYPSPPLNQSQFQSQIRTFSSSSSSPFPSNGIQPSEEENRKIVAYLGIGTNLGNRVENLSNALKKLRQLEPEVGLKVIDTSFLYESKAMYHEKQSNFLNACIKIQLTTSTTTTTTTTTTTGPLEVLEILKKIEKDLGRDFKTFRNGPRVIDLDLLLFDNQVFEKPQQGDQDDRWLKIPHKGINEREFVLRPLVDIAPLEIHPETGLTLTEQLSKLMIKNSGNSTVQRVFPLSTSQGIVIPYSRPSSTTTKDSSSSSSSKTLLMSIINTTPDSFSDGGLNNNLTSAIKSCKEHLDLGTDILDIGGMSTRPGASQVEEFEELERVLPLIKELRKNDKNREEGKEVIISVDTFRAKVAREAIEAGADLINDVHGGREEGMFETMKELGVPVVLMHSRGDSSNMNELTDYDQQGGVIEGVRKEMEQMVEQAIIEKGLNRWNIILDPGIGFAKTCKQNYQLLGNLDRLFGESQILKEFPVLVGISRKKFLGPEKLDAKDRVLETAAGVTACIASGRCEITRIHDTKEIRDAVKVADQIYRS
ncbi:hypothetical protein JCM3765_003893 [Sporobolomyces pararoseus]